MNSQQKATQNMQSGLLRKAGKELKEITLIFL